MRFYKRQGFSDQQLAFGGNSTEIDVRAKRGAGVIPTFKQAIRVLPTLNGRYY